MAAIGRFQKGDEVFHAKMVDGELFRLKGDVFGSPTFDKKPTPAKGVRILTPVVPSKIVAVGLNYADHARDRASRCPGSRFFGSKRPARCCRTARRSKFLIRIIAWITKRSW